MNEKTPEYKWRPMYHVWCRHATMWVYFQHSVELISYMQHYLLVTLALHVRWITPIFDESEYAYWSIGKNDLPVPTAF